MREQSLSVSDEEFFVALLASGICHYLNGNKWEAKKCYKDAHSVSKKLQLFNADPAAKKALKKSQGKVNQIQLGEVYDRIKRAVLMQEKSRAGEVAWYYYLQNDPLCKPDGWCAFENINSKEVEDMYNKYVASKRSQKLSTIVVSCGPILTEYEVDFQAMKQTNNMSGVRRPIMRSVDGKHPSKTPDITQQLLGLR